MADATPPPWMQPGAPPTHAKKEAAPPLKSVRVPRTSDAPRRRRRRRPAGAGAGRSRAAAAAAPEESRRREAEEADDRAGEEAVTGPPDEKSRRAAAARPRRGGRPPARPSARAALDVNGDGVAADGGDDQLKLPPLSRDIRLVVAHDWEQIVGKPIHWAPLPRKPCVADLLQTYAATKRQGGAHGQAWRDFAGCLISYFDAALPRLLLYRQERQQYDLRARGRGAPSRLYGAEHLVRLIIRPGSSRANLTKGEIPG